MSWRETLRRAAALVPEAQQQHSELEQLLNDVVARTATLGEIERLLGTPGERKSCFLDVLGAALLSRRSDLVAFNAARAVMYELPHVLNSIRVEPDVPTWTPAKRARMDLGLESIQARERELAKGEPVTYGTLRCPRCGWRDVATRHTDELERRYMEVRCEACGMYADWFEGDDESLAWEREQP